MATQGQLPRLHGGKVVGNQEYNEFDNEIQLRISVQGLHSGLDHIERK